MSIPADYSGTFETSHIHKFRDFINGNNHFVLNKYRNINGKNQWSVICSCMDWITVAVNYLSSLNISDSNEDVMSMKVYSLISSYDIIVESINQLHRVFFNTGKLPFKNGREIFGEKLSDFYYFKHIRAVFGAHPVNLDDIFNDDKERRFYASWSTSKLGSNHDMHVFLYSNRPGEKAIEFGFDFLKLQKFALKYYKYLDTIMDEIQRQYNEFASESIGQIIPKAEDTLSQIKTLKVENQRRHNSDYYGFCLDQLDMMFSAGCTNSDNQIAFDEYLKQLKKVVEEIYTNLQSMNICDLITDEILNPPRPSNKNYDYGKVFNYIYGADDVLTYHMFPYHFERIMEDLSKVSKIDANSEKNELLLLINTGLYFTNVSIEAGSKLGG